MITSPSSMTPYDRARHVYETEPCARTFDEDLVLHLRNGYVFCTPDYFIMGRAVRRDADPRIVVDPRWVHRDPDCWLIYLAAGDLRKFYEIEPHQLPWVGWEINNVLRFYPAERVKRMVLYDRTTRADTGRDKIPQGWGEC